MVTLVRITVGHRLWLNYDVHMFLIQVPATRYLYCHSSCGGIEEILWFYCLKKISLVSLLEPFAARRIISSLLAGNVKIDVLTTDRSSDMKAMMRYCNRDHNLFYGHDVYLFFSVIFYIYKTELTIPSILVAHLCLTCFTFTCNVKSFYVQGSQWRPCCRGIAGNPTHIWHMAYD